MKETLCVNPEDLQEKAQKNVDRLKEVAAKHERYYSPIIEAVLVFSGPGTYYKRLKDSRPEQEWMRWMDRDRIKAGVGVVREVTAKRIRKEGISIKGHYVTKEDIIEYGPLFVYNGIPEENDVLNKALNSELFKLPKEKVVIIDNVQEEDGTTHPIRHTADQVKSFYQELANPESPLYGISTVALVAHIPDFIRNVFYTKKYDDEHIARGNKGLNLRVYGLKSRKGSTKLYIRGTEQQHIESELQRLVEYAKRGYLATEPSTFSV